MSSSLRNRGSTCVRRGSTTLWPFGPRSTTGSKSKKTARPTRNAASRSPSNEDLDPHDLDLRWRAVRVCDNDPFAVAERNAVERRTKALRKSEGGELDDPAVRDGEDAILLPDAHRDARPGRELLGRELPRVFTLAKNFGPVRERPHLAEDPVADHPAHLRKEAWLDRIEPTGNELRAFFRVWQRAREHESELRQSFRERLRHRVTGGRERALLISAVGALGVTADLEDRHTPSVGFRARTRP